jgi:hypothetical protein
MMTTFCRRATSASTQSSRSEAMSTPTSLCPDKTCYSSTLTRYTEDRPSSAHTRAPLSLWLWRSRACPYTRAGARVSTHLTSSSLESRNTTMNACGRRPGGTHPSMGWEKFRNTLSPQRLSRLYKPWAADTHTHWIHT